MKHFRPDYNERIQDNANLIPEDEPVFLLRGQDIFTPGLMLDWAKQLRLAGGDPEFAQLIENGASEVIQWQKEHPERMVKNNRLRLPDMPKEMEVVKLLSDPYDTITLHDKTVKCIDVLVTCNGKETQTVLQVHTDEQLAEIIPGYKFKR